MTKVISYLFRLAKVFEKNEIAFFLSKFGIKIND